MGCWRFISQEIVQIGTGMKGNTFGVFPFIGRAAKQSKAVA